MVAKLPGCRLSTVKKDIILKTNSFFIFVSKYPQLATLTFLPFRYKNKYKLSKSQGFTSSPGQAKARFELDDLTNRGRSLIEEGIEFGVTHMRAFVEVDQTVGMKCLDAGLAFKEKFKDKCNVQICDFTQDPIYSQDDGGKKMVQLIKEAAARKDVDVIGSTPYVEKTGGNQHANIEWMISKILPTPRLPSRL